MVYVTICLCDANVWVFVLRKVLNKAGRVCKSITVKNHE